MINKWFLSISYKSEIGPEHCIHFLFPTFATGSNLASILFDRAIPNALVNAGIKNPDMRRVKINFFTNLGEDQIRAKILIVCGCSGSGKSTLVDELTKAYPHKFAKAVQFTTRPRREGEAANAYQFVDNEKFDSIAMDLVGKTEFLGNRYGTYIEFEEPKIQLVILNEEGIKDLRSVFGNKNVKVLGIKRNVEECYKSRETRSKEVIDKELDVYNYTDFIYDNDTEIDKHTATKLYDVIRNNTKWL